MKPPKWGCVSSEALLLLLVVGSCMWQSSQGLFLGCYPETPATRMAESMASGVWPAGDLNITVCELACVRASMRYSKVTGERACFCQRTAPTGTAVAASFCTASTNLYSSLSEVPMKIQDLSLKQATTLDAAFLHSVTFTLAWTNAPSVVVFSAVFGEGGPIEVLTHTPSPFIFTRNFHVPGSFKVTVSADEGSSISTEVSVEKAASLAVIVCPPIYELGVEMVCNASFQYAVGVAGVIDFGDTVLEPFSVADNSWWTAGLGIPLSWTSANTLSPPSTTLFNPASQFPGDFVVVGFEYYSMVASGTVNLMLLAPACSTDAYCYNDNSCSAAQCSIHQFTCNSPDLFFPFHPSCLHPSTTTFPSRYATTPDSIQYLTRQPVVIPGIGPQYFELPAEIQVAAGCVVGFESLATTNPLAAVAVTASETPDLSMATSSNAIDSTIAATPTTVRHLLRAVGYQPITLELFHTYQVNGIMNIVLTGSSVVGVDATATATTIISIIINDTTLIHPAIYKTNTPFVFHLLAHTGNNITYTWVVGDGTTDPITYVGNLTHTYTTPSCYNVNATAANVLSTRPSILTTMCLEDELIGLDIAHVVSTATQPSTFTLTLTSGSDYVCAWTYGDGNGRVSDVITTPITGIPFTHTYATEGAYDVTVFCHNNVSNATFNFIQYVQWAITNLRLERTAGVAMEDFYLVAKIDQGSNPNFTISFDNTIIPHNYDPATFTATSILPLNFDSSPYPVTVTCSNQHNSENVTKTYFIEYRIENPWTLCSVAETGVDVLVAFQGSVTGGSGVTMDWDFEDNNPHSLINLPGVKVPVGGLVDDFDHTFRWGGLMEVKTTIKNALSSHNFSCEVIVYGKIENVTLLGSDSASYLYGMGNASFYFISDQTLVKHKVVFDYGDGSPKQTFDFSTSRSYTHTYTTLGTYNVLANVSNPKLWGVLGRRVVVAVPIANLDIVLKAPCGMVGVAFDIGIALDNSDSVSLFYDFGDPASAATNTHSMTRTPTFTMYEADWWAHTYTQVGTYLVTLRAENVIGNTTLTYILSVMHHPTPFDLVINDVTLPPGVVTFSITLSASDILPTNATATIYFGDGTATDAVLYFTTPPYFMSLSHTYAIDNVYNATVIVHNLASNQSLHRRVGVYVTFSGFDLKATYHSDLQPASPTGADGLGDNGMSFPQSSDLLINTDFITGKADSYTVVITASNGLTTTLTFITAPIPLNFKDLGLAPGDYNIAVTAINGIDTTTQALDITIIKTLKAPDIQSLPTNQPDTVAFQLTFEDISEDACLVVDYGDGVVETFAKVASACDNISPITPTLVPSLTSPLALPSPPHKYLSDGTYEVTLKAVDLSGEHEVNILVTISKDGDCLGPSVFIKNVATNFLQPTTHQKSVQLDITSETDIQCDKSLENVKLWTVWLVEETTGKQTERQTQFDTYKTAKQAQLTIPKNTLQYGVYKFIYNVTVPSTNMYKYAYTFVHIIASDIIAYVAANGMSQVRRSYHDHITLSPHLHSYDPDLELGANQTFSSFEWFCRQRDESLPLNYDDTPLTTPINPIYTLSQFSQSKLLFKGGCFGTGPGVIDAVTGSLTFGTSMMQVNNSYSFSVIVGIGDRRMEAVLMVDLVDGYPPFIVVGCYDQALCTPETGRMKVNPNHRLTLGAACEKGCLVGWVWRWRAYRLGLNSAWLNIANFNEYVIGIEADAIAISSRIFEEFDSTYDGLINYRFEVSLSPPSGQPGYPGKAFIEVILNSKPTPGNCSLSPLLGTACYTVFRVECWGWSDEDGIMLYQLSATSTSDPSSTFQLGLSDDGSFKAFQLPSASSDHPVSTLVLNMKVVDGGGLAHEMEVGRVQLEQMQTDKSEALVTTLLSNLTTTNKMLTQAANGDVRQAASVFAMISDSLNQDFLYKTSDASASSVNSRTDLFEVTSSLIDDEAYQQRRNDRSQLRSKMVRAMNELTISDVYSIQLVAGSIMKLTKMPSEVNRHDQATLLDTLGYMVDTVKTLATTASLEQIVAAAADLVASIGNVLEGVIYIQEDGTIADIDDAKLDPLYFYDTDWESDRRSFHGMTKDSMKVGLQRETNTLVQKDAAQVFVPDLLKRAKGLNKVMIGKLVAGEEAISIETSSMSELLTKNTPQLLSGKKMRCGGGSVVLPDLCALLPCGEGDPPIGFEMISTQRNIFSHFPTPHGIGNYSGTVTLNIYDYHGKKINLKDLKSPLEIIIPRNYMPPINREPQNATLTRFRDESTLLYYRFNISRTEGSVSMQIVPSNHSTQYLLLLRHMSYPMLNGSDKGWDYIQNLPTSMQHSGSEDEEVVEERYTVFLNNDVLKRKNGTWFAGIRELEEEEHDTYSPIVTPAPPPLKSGQPSSNFSVLIFTSGCYHCNEDIDFGWSSNDGCKVSAKTKVDKTVCLCSHLTSFSGGFAVKPNTLDFDFILKNMDFMKNPTLYITEIIISILFIIGLIWARYKDKKDVQKLGVTPFADNHPKDRYLYEVIVSTGMRRNAGTKSKVQVILSGDMEETEVREVGRGEGREPFMRGNTDLFLMTVPRPLGALTYLRVWHDNSGKGRWASWYLNWVFVRDVQTQEKYHFLLNKWLAVEEDDGQISRLVAVSGREQLIETGHAFSKRATKGLNDDHIWFSIFGRPPQSRFTRTQRVSCCLCLLFTAMFANALFYGQTNGGAPGFDIGPFTITGEQLYVGLISNMIVFPINFLIAFLFKNSKPRFKRPSRMALALKKMKEKDEEKQAAKEEIKDGKKNVEIKEMDRRDDDDEVVMEADNVDDVKYAKEEKEKIVLKGVVEEKKKRKRKKIELPWWCIIISWILLVITVLGCVMGVTFYGIMFQDIKCRKWITSMLISFVASVLFTQPIKVIMLALFFSMVFKKPSEEEDERNEEDEELMELKEDEEWMHAVRGLAKVRKLLYHPPDPVALEKARQKRLNEIKMMDIVREVLFYAVFLYVLIVVSYDFRDVNSYNYKTTLSNKFISGGHHAPTPDNSIELVRSMEHFWNWLENTFVKGIRVDRWYNGDPPIGLRGYLDDTVSRVMGFATLRQLRVKPGLCKVAEWMGGRMGRRMGGRINGRMNGGMGGGKEECNVGYSMWDEDRADYGAEWRPINQSINQSSYEAIYKSMHQNTLLNYTPPAIPLAAFTYKSSQQLDGFPYYGKHAMYSGGGYVVELRGDRNKILQIVQEAKKNRWIDQYTRAIFIEFATYNSQINLFGVGHMIAELLVTGGFDCYYRVDTMNLLGNLTSSKLIQTVLQAVFCVFILFFIIKEIRNMVREGRKYLRQFWSFVEWLIILMSILSVAMYIYRNIMTNRLTNIFAKSGGNAYMKFTGVSYWHESLLQMIAVLVFWATLKFLKLLRFNKTIGLLSSTLRCCANCLINFAIMFGLVFFSFVHFFHLLYLPTLEVFSDLILASQQCLMMMVGKFNFSEMARASPVLGTLFFFLYMVTIFFVLMTMFVGIICDAFATVREDSKMQCNEHEIVDFVVAKVTSWTGISRMWKKKVGTGRFKAGEPLDSEALAAFPERLDRMLENISKLYYNKDQFETLFKNGTDLKGGQKGGEMGMKGGKGVNTYRDKKVAFSEPDSRLRK